MTCRLQEKSPTDDSYWTAEITCLSLIVVQTLTGTGFLCHSMRTTCCLFFYDYLAAGIYYLQASDEIIVREIQRVNEFTRFIRNNPLWISGSSVTFFICSLILDKFDHYMLTSGDLWIFSSLPPMFFGFDGRWICWSLDLTVWSLDLMNSGPMISWFYAPWIWWPWDLTISGSYRLWNMISRSYELEVLRSPDLMISGSHDL